MIAQNKVCIEYLGKDIIRLTTLFRQKTIDLEKLGQEYYFIDLIKLEPSTTSENLRFWALVDDAKEGELSIYAEGYKNGEAIDTLDSTAKMRTYNINLWYDNPQRY